MSATKLPLRLMRRKMYHLIRWKYDIEQHLIHCKVEGMERKSLKEELVVCLREMKQLNRDIESARALKRK